MKTLTLIWKPAWYELDQPLTVGEIGCFDIIKTDEYTAFATGLDNGLDSINCKILNIINSKLGNIIKIDTQGLSYRFYTEKGDYIQIEAEEQPGVIEGSYKSLGILQDTRFYVEVQLIEKGP